MVDATGGGVLAHVGSTETGSNAMLQNDETPPAAVGSTHAHGRQPKRVAG
jgi:hypothetical protein